MKSQKCPHVYGFGTRLSNAYTMGCDGLPAAPWMGGRDSAAYKAWALGRKELDRKIDRLTYLSRMLGKYGQRWGEAQENGGEPSLRMYGWVDEYNSIKEESPAVWAEYCKRTGAAPEHNAYDCLA